MKIGNARWADLVSELMRSIKLAHELSGTKIKPEAASGETESQASARYIDEMASSLAKILTHSHGSLSVEDVTDAIYNGAIGNYGDFRNISVKTLYDWVKAASPERTVNCQAREDQQQRSYTASQLIAMRIYLINDCYSKYLNGTIWACDYRDVLRTLAGYGLTYGKGDARVYVQAPWLKLIDVTADDIERAERSVGSGGTPTGNTTTVGDAVISMGGNEAFRLIISQFFAMCSREGRSEVYRMTDDQMEYIEQRRAEQCA